MSLGRDVAREEDGIVPVVQFEGSGELEAHLIARDGRLAYAVGGEGLLATIEDKTLQGARARALGGELQL